MTTLRHDVRVALRRLSTSPGFTLVAALTMALGIGANTAIFSVVYGVLMRPVGVEDPDGLAALSAHRAGTPGEQVGFWPAHLEWFEEAAVGRGGIQALASYLYDSVTLHGGDQPIELGSALMVDGRFFDVLGVDAVVGRTFTESDVVVGRRGSVCVISEALWRGRFAADPTIAGRVLNLDGEPVTVVGVMPSDVPLPQTGIQLWMPQGWDTSDVRLSGRLSLLVRTVPGNSPEVAQSVLETAGAEIFARSARLEGYTVSMIPFRDTLVGSARPGILATAGAVGLILLVACANMASLLLSRAVVREREIATRRALGASRGQLTTQLLSESLALAVLGGLLGVGLAFALHRVLLGLAGGLVPRLADVRLDEPVLAFAAAASVVTGVLFGLAPVGFAMTRNLAGAMRAHGSQTGAGLPRVRQLLVVSQVAVAVVLVTAAALFLRSLSELDAVDPGFHGAGVGGARIYLDDTAYPDDAHEFTYFEQILERLRATPGIVSAGATSGLPMDPQTIDYDLPYTLPGEASEDASRQAHFRTVSPGYLETLDVPLLRGRPLRASDRADSESVAVINATFARIAWGDADPVGDSFAIYGGRRALRVVGVVGDVRFHGPGQETRPAFFVPYGQMTYGAMTVVVRAADPYAAADAVAAAALEIDARQPVHSTFALADLEHGAIASERFYSRLLLAFAAVALLLAGAGIYSVLAFWIGESRRELGIRMAVGADAGTIVSLVLRRSLGTTAIGLGLGLATVVAGARALEPYLFGVRATDALALGGVVVVLAAIALAASMVPALRAARLDPVTALRLD